MNGQVSREHLPLTDHRLAAAARLLGGRLEEVVPDPVSGRLTFIFSGLPKNFVEQVFNGDIRVSLRDFVASLEDVHAVIAQYRARWRRS